MISVCWFRTSDDNDAKWIKGHLWLLENTGAIVTEEHNGKPVRVAIENLWIHQYAPTHSQFI